MLQNMKKTEERLLKTYEAPTVMVVEFRVECGFAGSLEMLGSGPAYGNGDFDGDFASDEGGFSNSGGMEGLSSGRDYSDLF